MANLSATLFDAKLFNGEVFQQYVDRIPNVHLNALIQSGAIIQRPELASAMSDQVGGNYLTTPLKGLIGGDPLNYDGQTNITATSTKTYSHSRVVVGRAKAWTEKDFSYDITGGVDFMQNVAEQVSEYWDEKNQEMLIAILNGIFAMGDEAGAEFAQTHTSDITGITNSEGVLGFMDATTLNTAMQKACGDQKQKFSLCFMHSAVATHLENLKVLVYLKYNDANGIERDLNIGTLNGRMVVVDDDMPVQKTEVTAGVYTVTIGGTVAIGDKFTVAGYTVTATAATAANVANALATAMASDARYSVSHTEDTAVVTLTEKSGKYATGAPYAQKTSEAGTVTIATTTSPVVTKAYTTFVLGQGAFEYTDCGAKVPAEMSRDAATNGGQDTLYSRNRKCFAPYGISFTQAVMSTLSPTNDELSMGVNWKLVNTNGASDVEYINHKVIPIARIISLG